MKNHKFLWWSAFALALLALTNGARAQGTAFTYQGQLSSGGQPANGIYDFQFALYPTNSGPPAVVPSATSLAVAVTNGLFTTLIDFGPGVFTGGPAWLQLAVRTNGSSSFMPLTPRQQITPAPLAIFASSASNLLGTIPVAQLSGVLPDNQLPGNVVTNSQPSANFFAGNGAGVNPGGSANTGVGNSALNANTSGAYNTALGQTALANNTVGFQNTAVGQAALFSNTNGLQNTAVGAGALGANLSGSDNAAFGIQASSASTNNSTVTAIGAGALHQATGDGNTALGAYAGVNITTGANNIHIGNSGESSDNAIIRLGTPGTQSDTYLTGLIHGNNFMARGGPILGFNYTQNGYTFDLPGDNDSGMSSSANGQIEFYSNGSEVMRIASGGYVGIGLTNPVSPLTVNGNIQLGNGGTNYATSGQENLRIVRGLVNANGGIVLGSGFTVPSHPSAGSYTINFTPPFSGSPVVTVTGVSTYALAGGTLSASTVTVQLNVPNGGAGNGAFSFIAIGPP